MFQLLTGRLVHEARTIHAGIVAAATQPAPRIVDILPTLSPGLAETIDRALAYNSSERWPNARAMRRSLTLAMPSALDTPSAQFPNSITLPEATLRPARTRPIKLSWGLPIAGSLLLGLLIALPVRRAPSPPGVAAHTTPPASVTAMPEKSPPALTPSAFAVTPPVHSNANPVSGEEPVHARKLRRSVNARIPPGAATEATAQSTGNRSSGSDAQNHEEQVLDIRK